MTGKFSAHVNWCDRFLKHLELFEEHNFSPQKVESPLSLFRDMTYEQVWKYCVTNSVYKFLLKDSSIIQINYSTESNFSFCYYASPYEAQSYRDFLIESDIDFNEIGYDFYGEYEEYLLQSPKKQHPVMIRYDYAPNDYNEGHHPASHMHIGFNNDIRIGLKFIMSPQSFFLLIVRLCYPNQWIALLNLEGLFDYYQKVLRIYISELEPIEKKHFKTKDSFEFYIS